MGKNQSASGLTNIIQYDNAGNISFVSGSTTLLAISSSGAVTTTGVISGSDAANAISASYALTATSASFASNATSASFASNAATATSASQAQNAVSSSFAANANLLDSKDSTEFAITSSNIFTGTQYITNTINPNGFGASASIYTDGGLRVTKDTYISGTMFVNNLTVFGTQSVNYVTSSQLNISTNIISVNTDTPSIRFGGLSVYDSGSTGLTGSMLWDSERDHWVYSNPSGSSYNSGMMISGPRNSGSLGTEQGTINNVIVKGQGGDHVTSSQIIDDGTTVRIPGNLQVTGSLSGSSAVFSGTVIASNGTLAGGTGTTNYLPKFTGASTIGNSAVSDDGTSVAVGITITANTGNLQVGGTANTSLFSQQGTDTVRMGVRASGRTGISLDSSNATFTNRMWYLDNVGANGSLTIGRSGLDVLTFSNGGNLGLGVTPSAWNTGYRAMQITSWSSFASDFTYNGATEILTNAYIGTASASNYIYTNSAASTRYKQVDGIHSWSVAPSGTAGNAISFTQAMTLNASGNLGIGVSDPDIFSRGDARTVGISASGASDNMSLHLNAGASGGRGAQIYMGQGGTRHFTISSNVTETRAGTTTSTPLILTTNDTTRLTIAASTGAATFASSVSTGNLSLSGGTIQSSGDFYIGTNNANFIQFYTSNENRMIITSGGNVGIGVTPTTGNRFWIKGSDSAFGNTSLITQNAGGTITFLVRNDGSAQFASSDTNGWYAGFSNLGTNFAYMGATAQFANSGGTSTDFGIRSTNALAFYTSNGNERMRITSGGEVNISNSILRINASSTTSVSTSATTISTGSNTYGGLAIVWGADVPGNVWTDLLFYSLGQVFVIRGQDVSGGPAGRTYSVNGSGALRLAMASGTYTVRYQALLTA